LLTAPFLVQSLKTKNKKLITMKKIILIGIFMPLLAQAQLKTTLKKAVTKATTSASATNTSDATIGAALKEALNKGVSNQVSKLTAVDGFLKNDAVKILLPAELQKVDNTLRKIGMSSLADEGIKVLNRAAESAVKALLLSLWPMLNPF
jgi:guanyl-specific ribonuclease Sa